MAENGNGNGSAPKWPWVAKIALSALGVVIMLLLADIRGMQAHLSVQTDTLTMQMAAVHQNMIALSAEVSAQRVAVDAALSRLHYFRSDEDKDWQNMRERLLRLELQRERAKSVRDGATP